MRFFAVTLLSLAAAISLAAQQPAASAGPTTPQNSATTAQTTPQASPPAPSSPPSQPPEAAPASSQPASQQPSAQAVQVPSTMPPGTSMVPTVTPKERAEAKRDFKEGMKLKSAGKLDPAFRKFEQAAELDPHNLDYITAREFTRQQLVMEAL